MHDRRVRHRPRNCRYSRDGRLLYVPPEVDATLSVVDVTHGSVQHTFTLPGAGARPMGIVLSPDGRFAYLTTGRGGHLLKVDLAIGKVDASVAAGERPWGVALSADGRQLYTADGPSNTVSIIDTATMHRNATVQVGKKPWGVTTSPASARADATRRHAEQMDRVLPRSTCDGSDHLAHLAYRRQKSGRRHVYLAASGCRGDRRTSGRLVVATGWNRMDNGVLHGQTTGLLVAMGGLEPPTPAL